MDNIDCFQYVLAALIRGLRKHSGVTRQELAEAAGVRLSVVRRCETTLGGTLMIDVMRVVSALGFRDMLVYFEANRRLMVAGVETIGPAIMTKAEEKKTMRDFAKITGFLPYELEEKFRILRSIPILVPPQTEPSPPKLVGPPSKPPLLSSNGGKGPN